MRFDILGPLRAESTAGPVKISGSRRTALLGALLMHPGRLLRTGDLIDAVWAERPPASAVDNIRTYVSELRHTFQRHGGGRMIIGVSGGYRCEVNTDDLDLTEFRRLDEEGREALAVGNHTQAGDLLGEAAGLWRGDPLEGIEVGAWLHARIESLTELRWSNLVAWAEARLELGDYEQLVPMLTEMVAERALHERVWEMLMHSMYGCGRTADALATYGRARQTFIDELGIEPGPGLQSLHARMLDGDAGLAPRARAHPVVVRGAGRSAVGGPRSGVMPHLLPPRPQHLVGRADVRDKLTEVAADVHRRLGDSAEATPVVALSGAPGIGKSAVAIDAAHELRHFFPDGELYVDLQAHSGRPRSGSEALGILLAGFGASRLSDNDDERLALYRQLLIDRRLFLLLDNALDVDHVRPLLPVAGASLVVVTSRRRLVELDSHWQTDLQPLDRQAAWQMLADSVGTARISQEPEATTRIIDACEGVPLAVRAAGARLAAHPSYPIRALADRLTHGDDLLGELAFGSLDVRVALRDSYQALPSSTRVAFRAIGARAPATITPRIVGELLDVSIPTADRLLERLLRDNLLQPRPSSDGEPRYGMFDLVRAYAREERTFSCSGSAKSDLIR